MVVSKENYIKWTIGHMKKNAKPIERSRLVEVEKQAWKKLKKFSNVLSNKEYKAIQQSIVSKAIPSPQLLIKDHKDPDGEGNYPTRLVVPATNFTARFPQAGYLGIKAIFDKNNVNYAKRTIVQASDLKETLEKLNISNKDTTIVSIDAKEFYPSVRFKLVKKAVNYFQLQEV